MKKKIIYDLGANNGDDVPYYLLKSDLVVAVEANPVLCDLIRARFSAQIKAGRLAVENCVVTAASGGVSDFHVHKLHHVRSLLLPPSLSDAGHFERVILPAKPIAEILATYGDPYYIKLDIEHYDAQILRALFSAGVTPPFISAESQSVEVFALLVAQGGYNAFKLVDGYTVSKVYSDRLVAANEPGKQVRYSFPFHSAGPFGEEVDGEWLTADNFLRVLALAGLGWVDIHATNTVLADPAASMSTRDWLLRYLLREARFRKRAVVANLRRLFALGRS